MTYEELREAVAKALHRRNCENYGGVAWWSISSTERESLLAQAARTLAIITALAAIVPREATLEMMDASRFASTVSISVSAPINAAIAAGEIKPEGE